MMWLFVILLGVAAIPVGIVVFTVIATTAEQKIDDGFSVSRRLSALVFGTAAFAAVAFVGVMLFLFTGEKNFPTFILVAGTPIALITALLAAAWHRFLIGSQFHAALCGMAIVSLTAFGFSLITSSLSRNTVFTLSFLLDSLHLTDRLLFSPLGILSLFFGAFAGAVVSHIASTRRAKAALEKTHKMSSLH